MKRTTRPIAVDIFCGVGGMSLGFEQAGFAVAAAVDADPIHTRTYSANFPHTKTITADLAALSGPDLRQMANLRLANIDVLFGGPECQGFSTGGKRRRGDPRNLLLLHFARLVGDLRPSYFVLENVEGLIGDTGRDTLGRFLKMVSRDGYVIVEPIASLNASSFGVPQHRRRVFILGYRRSLQAPHYPSRSCSPGDNGDCASATVWDAIGDLPDVEEFEELLNSDHYHGELGTPSHYASTLRGDTHDPHDRSLPRILDGPLTGCLRTRHSDETRRRFSATVPGTFEPVSRFFRLPKNGLARTLRAGTGPSNGSFTAPRPIHPIGARCITVREAARLHSFPDWVQFHPTKWHGFRQIGNSVPPMLACAVASDIRALL